MFDKYRPFYFFGASVLIYTALTYLIPPDPAVLHQYKLSVLTLRLIYITFLVPLFGIWFAAIFGYAKLRKYANLIKKNKDGKEITKLARGLMVLAFGLPITSIIAICLNYLARLHPRFLPTATITNNYISLLLPAMAFLIIGEGAFKLSEQVKQRPQLWVTRFIVLVFCFIGVGYCYLVFNAASPVTGLLAAQQAIYYLPNWLLMASVVTPYLFIWLIGLLSAYEIFLYHQKVAGVIYKKAWAFVSVGLSFIILSSIILQYLTTLSRRLTQLRFNALLLLVYGLLILISVGYILVALGARRLQKIEEI